MATKNKWLIILVTVLVFGTFGVGSIFSQAGSGGILTITDIPARFNGKYALFFGENNTTEILGVQSFNMADGTGVGVRIENGRVNIPVWIERAGDLVRYNGSRTFYIEVGIVRTAKLDENLEEIAGFEFDEVTFRNGSATISFHDYDDFWEDGENY